MAICIGVLLLLSVAIVLEKKGKVFQKFRKEDKKILFQTLLISSLLATAIFTTEMVAKTSVGKMLRNTYGEGSKTEIYEVAVEGEKESETIEIQIEEREYTSDEIRKIFEKAIIQLDEVFLGENESRDRVEKRLNLPTALEGYPIDIEWELDNYHVLTLDGEINQEELSPEGTKVELRAVLSYGMEEMTYATSVRVYPETKTERETWVEEIKRSVAEAEEKTREREGFYLPELVAGKKVVWKKKKDLKGYYVLAFGVLIGGLLIWKNRKDEYESKQKAKEQMIRDYPDIISKLTLLLSTGMTLKAVWTKIVQEYEKEKAKKGKRYAYEEMKITYHEMQSAVPEQEAYERFGRRCRVISYVKLGALLSQNLKKGGKGLCELLQVEAIQAFENRKSMARKTAEEAQAKLLIPMFGMLTIVMVIVIIPAFLSIQI